MAEGAFLGVDKSLLGSRWVSAGADEALTARIAQSYGVPEIVARLLSSRGVTFKNVDKFLNPTLRRDFPDPFALAGMEAMARDLARAVVDKIPMGIFGDFDVDGATSSAILTRFFRHCGLEVPVYIPDRLTEGYGPNVEAFRKLKDDGAQIVILCDCGTTAFDTLAAAREMGLRVIVLDHHEAEETLPPAWHVVNPKRRDDASGLAMLAACGVVFMACVAVNKILREDGYYEQAGLAEPPLKDWMDIAALGTVADMVPLTHVNRIIVRTGFSLMANTINPGLKALVEVSGITGAPDVYHAGFVLGPRINAGSRIHKADLGARLLATDDPEEARNIAWTLNDCNEKRKELQAEMTAEAIAMVEAGGLDRQPVIVVGDPGWHPGLAGLVAGRLKEQYNRPAVVIAYTENGAGVLEGRGSGRSVPGVNIAAAFMDARNAGILLKGGGHAMAGGFTVEPGREEELKAFLYSHILNQAGEGHASVESRIDGVFTVGGLNVETVKMIHGQVGPFGQGFEEPLFVLPDVRIVSADVLGGAHVRVMATGREGGPRIKAMAFRAAETPLGRALLSGAGGGLFHLAGHAKINEWQGRESAEFHIRDAAPAMIAPAAKKTEIFA